MALLLASCFVVIAQLGMHTARLAGAADDERSSPYALHVARKTDRAILFVVDSLPIRIAEDESYMPRLARTMRLGASGVLWASKQTGTQQGIVGLGTGRPTSALDFLGQLGGSKLDKYTIFADLRQRGESVSFNGESRWITFFGGAEAHNHPNHGGAESFFDEDLRAIASAEAELRSPAPPALTVIHITETDFAAHQFGTSDARYRAVMRRWDEVLQGFFDRVLDGRTTLILTSDHGNDVWGSHGGGGDIYRQVPVVLLGKGIRPAHGFTMNSVDMPATLALLLGARLPGEALAKPATAPIALTAEEEAGALLGTYDHLISLGERSLEPAAPAHRARYRELERLAQDGQAATAAARAEQAIPQLIEAITPVRRLSLVEMGWAALTFLAAAGLALASFAPDRATGDVRWWSRIVATPALVTLCAIGAVEMSLIVRFSFAPWLKLLASAHRTSAALPPLMMGMVAAATGAATLRAGSSRVTAAVARYPREIILVGFVACSALLPLSNVAILFLCLLVIGLSQARTPALPASLTLVAFSGYFTFSAAIGWKLLGESPARRYAYGLSAAAVGLLWLARGPLRGADRGRLFALFLLLVLFPFGSVNLAAAGSAAPAVAVASLGLLGAMVIRGGGSRLCLVAVAAAATPHLAGSSALLLAALAVIAALFIHQLWTGGGGQAAISSLGCILVAALSAMSGSADVPSIVAFFLVLRELSGRPSEGDTTPDDLHIGLLAAAVVCGRYALFELFGHVDSPAASYGLRHLDLAIGLRAGANLNVALATLLILLKLAIASSVVLGAILATPRARRIEPRIVALVGAFMLIDLGHTSLRMSLSLGALSDRYDEYLVSLFIRTVVYLSLVLGYALRAGSAANPRAARLSA